MVPTLLIRKAYADLHQGPLLQAMGHYLQRRLCATYEGRRQNCSKVHIRFFFKVKTKKLAKNYRALNIFFVAFTLMNLTVSLRIIQTKKFKTFYKLPMKELAKYLRIRN